MACDTIEPMSDFKPKPGSFLPFLESSSQDKPSAPSAPPSPLTLLEILARRADRSLPLFDLQTLSGMEPSRYSDALKGLQSAGYIELASEGIEPVVRLTDNGQRVAQLARPA
jgi:hypothetical protein